MKASAPVDRADRAARPTRTPTFNARRCKQCGICAHICPAGALVAPARATVTPTLPEPGVCNGCRACEYICPDFAVKMTECPAAAGDARATVRGTLSAVSGAAAGAVGADASLAGAEV